MLREYKDAWNRHLSAVFVTVDAVVRCAGRVLLIRRGRRRAAACTPCPAASSSRARPSGESCLRELVEETHLELPEETMRAALREVAVFDHPDRSQRGRIITHAHYFDFGDREPPQVRADDDAQSVEWVPTESLASMEDRFHDDHFHILDRFLGLIREGERGVTPQDSMKTDFPRPFTTVDIAIFTAVDEDVEGAARAASVEGGRTRRALSGRVGAAGRLRRRRARCGSRQPARAASCARRPASRAPTSSSWGAGAARRATRAGWSATHAYFALLPADGLELERARTPPMSRGSTSTRCRAASSRSTTRRSCAPR
jgi:ADP-ribose pyrophosphatase YjhB (NUDIX family)